MLLFVLNNRFLIKFLLVNDAEVAVLYRVHENVSLMLNLACMLVTTNAGQPVFGNLFSMINHIHALTLDIIGAVSIRNLKIKKL